MDVAKRKERSQNHSSSKIQHLYLNSRLCWWRCLELVSQRREFAQKTSDQMLRVVQSELLLCKHVTFFQHSYSGGASVLKTHIVSP